MEAERVAAAQGRPKGSACVCVWEIDDLALVSKGDSMKVGEVISQKRYLSKVKSLGEMTFGFSPRGQKEMEEKLNEYASVET